jgi:hypothetical protein
MEEKDMKIRGELINTILHVSVRGKLAKDGSYGRKKSASGAACSGLLGALSR